MYLPLVSALLILTMSLEALNLSSLAVQYDSSALKILNQQKLPGEEEWIDVTTPEQMVEIITSLKVRGAPLLGIAGILSLAQLAERGESVQIIEKAAHLLRASRPTAVNLANYIDRILQVIRNSSRVHEDIL